VTQFWLLERNAERSECATRYKSICVLS